ncbi:hypothetical protein BSLG_001595 [Batrachochytrium salamandrivorans]|nr:hypothetical protein BSLG_001595 [Batrachochytrium salamandrivorans]
MPILVSTGCPDVQTVASSYSNMSGSSAAGTSGALIGSTRVIARHIQKNVRLLFDPLLPGCPIPPKGDLYVTESQLVWFDPETLINISIDYPTIIIHAISRQGDPFANGPCIYSQLSATSGDGAEISQTSSAPNSNGGSADNEETFEMRLVPDDPSSLDAIYQAMSDCAAMHPDPDTEIDMDDDDEMAGGDWTFDPETAESVRFSEVGQAALEHLETVFGVGVRPEILDGHVAETSVSSTTPRDANGDEISSESGLEEARVQGERVANRTEVPSTTGQFDDAEEDR